MSKHKPLTLYVNVNKASRHVNPISFEQENVYRASDVKSEDMEAYVSVNDLFKVLNSSRIDDDFKSTHELIAWIKDRSRG